MMVASLLAVADRVDVAAAIAAPDWLCSLWFVLMCVLLAGYAILDGFDLGVGIIHFIVGRTDADRTAHVSVIGPIWDGNEVWRTRRSSVRSWCRSCWCSSV
jgi:hypothetical protein